jgi:hypothetical protein
MLQILDSIARVCLQSSFWLMLASRRRTTHALHQSWLATQEQILGLPPRYFAECKPSTFRQDDAGNILMTALMTLLTTE